MACPPLTCPVCGDALTLSDRTLRCATGHSFDVSRHGYVDLLPHGHGRSGRTGDTRDMIAARRRFLDAGHYALLRDAVAARAALASRAARESVTTVREASGTAAPVLLEAGCGDGYYLAAAATAADAACALGFDISPHALRAASRRCRNATLFINDVSHRICLPDGSVDVLLDVFAPRNAAEFSRVLRPGGTLLVVVPGAAHLEELAQLLPIGAAPDKAATVRALFADAFDVVAHDSLSRVVHLDRAGLADLLQMMPGSWHGSVPADSLPVAATVTAAFELLDLRRRGP